MKETWQSITGTYRLFRRLQSVQVTLLDDGQWAVICRVLEWQDDTNSLALNSLVEVDVILRQDSEDAAINVQNKLLDLIVSFWDQFDNIMLGEHKSS